MNENPVGGAPAPSPYRLSAPAVAATSEVLELGPRYAAVRLHTQCQACIQPVPVNGLHREVECPYCGVAVAIAPGVFTWIADGFEQDHRELRGAGRRATSYGQHTVDNLQHVAKPDSETWVQEPIAAWFEELAPTAAAVWRPQSCASVVEPVAFACPSCHAGMHITAETPRVCRCDDCDARVFIPEALWSELHGTPAVETWVIEFRGENRFDRKRREDKERERSNRARERTKQRRVAQAEARKKAAAAQALRTDVARISTWARRTNLLHLIIAGSAIAWPWIATSLSTQETWPHVVSILAGVLMYAAGFVALGFPARLITRVSGQQDLGFEVWFNIPFVLLFPVIGNLFAFEAAWGLSHGRYRERLGPCTQPAARVWAWIGVTGLLYTSSLLLAYVQL